MTGQSEDASTVDDYEDSRIRSSRWPLVIGTVSVLYASLGFLLNLMALLAIVVGPVLQANYTGVKPVSLPPLLLIGQLILVIALLSIGVLLLVSGIATLKRRNWGPRGINLWVILRLALLLVAVLFQVFTVKASVDWQLASQEAVRDGLRDDGHSDEQIKKWSPELEATELRTRTIVWALSFTAMLAVCPIVLGLVLSSKRIREEWTGWP